MLLNFISAYTTLASETYLYVLHITCCVLCAYHAKKWGAGWEAVLTHAAGGFVFTLAWQLFVISKMTTRKSIIREHVIERRRQLGLDQ